MEAHRCEWECPLCPRSPFIKDEEFKNHLRSRHSLQVSDVQLPLLVKAGRRPVESVLASSCLFCHDWDDELRIKNPQISPGERISVTPEQFRCHVGGHMEQLALFAIPRGQQEEGDADSNGAAAAAQDLDSKRPTNPADYLNDLREGVSDDEPAANPLLHMAAYEGELAEVQRLIDDGVDIESYGSWWGSALIAATAGGHIDIVKALADRGADLNLKNDNGKTALHVAVETGNDALVKLLVDFGSDLTKEDRDGYTPQQLAEKLGFKEVEDALYHRPSRADPGVESSERKQYQDVSLVNSSDKILQDVVPPEDAPAQTVTRSAVPEVLTELGFESKVGRLQEGNRIYTNSWICVWSLAHSTINANRA
jgi:hypothetical protein